MHPELKIEKIKSLFKFYYFCPAPSNNSSQDDYTLAGKYVPTDTFLFQCISVTRGSDRGPNSGQESPESIHIRFLKNESHESIQSRCFLTYESHESIQSRCFLKIESHESIHSR